VAFTVVFVAFLVALLFLMVYTIAWTIRRDRQGREAWLRRRARGDTGSPGADAPGIGTPRANGHRRTREGDGGR
jgi:hypothetical protein